MSQAMKELASIAFDRPKMGGSWYLARKLYLPVVPSILPALQHHSVALYTPSGMGGVYTVKGYGKQNGNTITFKVRHGDARFDLVVTNETMPGCLLWCAQVPTGFKPSLAPNSILTACWDETHDRLMDVTSRHDQFYYTEAKSLGAERSYRLKTGLEFLLESVI